MYVMPRDFAERTERFSMPEPNSGCWLWTGWVNDRGYGQFHDPDDRRIVLAHRASWEHHNQRAAGDLYVCHKCDVRSCINPAHLFIGTAQDNASDMVAKKRNKWPTIFGEANVCSKLTEAQVHYIRCSPATDFALGAEIGVVSSLISEVRTGSRWAHIPFSDEEIAATAARRRSRIKLCAEDVSVILDDKRDCVAIAAAYGVSPATIYDIKRGFTWRHVRPDVVRRKLAGDPTHNMSEPLKSVRLRHVQHDGDNRWKTHRSRILAERPENVS